MSLASTQNQKFQRNLAISLVAHVGIFAFSMWWGKSSFQKIDLSNQGSKVIWAELASSPPKTAEDKLPGPVVKPQSKAKEVGKKFVLDDSKATKTLDTKTSLSDALAGLNLEDDIAKPTPRADNFASNADSKNKGITADPTGGGISDLIKYPEVLAYQNKINRIIVKNFLWIREDGFQAKIIFKININGEVLEPKILASSKNASFDQACLRAAKKSSPLPSPPLKFQQQLLQQEFVIRFKR